MKLSPLQKFIIQEAYKTRGACPNISNADVPIRWYGFKPSWSGKIKFSRSQVGIKRYLSATAAVARSFTRLRERNLMVRSPRSDGHVLTSAGRKIQLQV